MLCNEINARLVMTLESLGAAAMGLHTLGTSVLVGERLFLEEDERKIDLGYVGRVTEVNARLLGLLCDAGQIAVLAPLARNRTGSKLNCNADTAAGEVAAALQADKYVLVSDTHGIRTDPDDEYSLAAALSETEIRGLIDRDVIAGGMLPKVESCLRALDAGVRRAHIIDGGIPHALLLEIFTDRGVGTLIQK